MPLIAFEEYEDYPVYHPRYDGGSKEFELEISDELLKEIEQALDNHNLMQQKIKELYRQQYGKPYTNE